MTGDMEQNIFTIISCAGGARSLCFEALQAARKGDYRTAEQLLASAETELLKTHEVHYNMLQKEACGEEQPISLLLIHAEDHLMLSLFAKDLVKEMIAMLRQIAGREE